MSSHSGTCIDCNKAYHNLTRHQQTCHERNERLRKSSEALTGTNSQGKKNLSGLLGKLKSTLRLKGAQKVDSHSDRARKTPPEGSKNMRIIPDVSKAIDASIPGQGKNPSSEEQEPAHLNDIDSEMHIDVPALPAVGTPASHAPAIALPPTRSGRLRTAPRALQDFVPSVQARSVLHEPLSRLVPPPPPPPRPTVETVEDEDDQPVAEASTPVVEEDSEHWYRTVPDSFGIYRRYPFPPQRDPDQEDTVDDFVDAEHISAPDPLAGSEYRNPIRTFSRKLARKLTKLGSNVPFHFPLTSVASFRLLHHQYTGSAKKSRKEMQRLVRAMVKAGFEFIDLVGLDLAREDRRLTKAILAQETLLKDGWSKGKITIRLPLEKKKHASEDEALGFEIDNVLYRKLVPMITETCKSLTAAHFQFVPFETWWKKPDGTEERMYTEAFDTDAVKEEQIRLMKLPPNPDDPPNTEIVILPMGGYSDGTHLAQFGTASLWPIYVYFLSLSKYVRNKPDSFAANHAAYIPTLPDKIQDIYKEKLGRAASEDILRLLRSEVLQGVWRLILDEEFLHAYEHGILVVCGDGVTRRVFPRFLTYSADYPEKMAIACLRFLARCPCPRCYTVKDYVKHMGSTVDAKRRAHLRVDKLEIWNKVDGARKLIFQDGTAVKGTAPELLLKPWSLRPNRSAFSQRLAPFGFNHYQMFVSDLMHEFELGVWKHVFKHILRVLYAFGGLRIQQLNERFREVQTFGNGTIRRFGSNVSGLKKLAARDYENILQCVIPCVKGLFVPRLEAVILDMLWYCLLWHALAKLRMHSTTTARIFAGITPLLGGSVRDFTRKLKKAKVETYELPGEEAARGRRDINARKAGKKRAVEGKKKKKKVVVLNLSTYKWHNIGHYPSDILRHGPTDCYSTQGPESEHKRVKRHYGLSNHKNVAESIGLSQQKERVLVEMKAYDVPSDDEDKWEVTNGEDGDEWDDNDSDNEDEPPKPPQSTRSPRPAQRTASKNGSEDEELPKTSFEMHHQISHNRRDHKNIFELMRHSAGHPAYNNYVVHLKNLALARKQNVTFTGEETQFTSSDRATVKICCQDREYSHKTMRVNFTTYDRRRDQDTINPRTHSDIAVLAGDEADSPLNTNTPFWYAKVLGIHHIVVQFQDLDGDWGEPEDIEYLRVHWYGGTGSPNPFEARRLPTIRPLSKDEPGAFGVLDPSLVVRGVHLIPHYDAGRTAEGDWREMCVMIAVDRDMFMRFLGGGVGHKGLHHFVSIAQNEAFILGLTDIIIPDSSSDDGLDPILQEVAAGDNARIDLDAMQDEEEYDEDAEDDEEESDAEGAAELVEDEQAEDDEEWEDMEQPRKKRSRRTQGGR